MGALWTVRRVTLDEARAAVADGRFVAVFRRPVTASALKAVLRDAGHVTGQ